jgi:hypothetical protein
VKEINITIKGNDTTFNGKNLKQMNNDEKQQALAEINKTVRPKGRMLHREMAFDMRPDSDRIRYFTYRTDSGMRFNGEGMNGQHALPRLRLDMDMRRDGPGMNDRIVRVRGFNMGNAQTFNYNYSDKNGINTHISYRVTDAFADAIRKVAGVEKADLELKDLTLTPQFSTGNTVLSFALPAKSAEIRFTDTDGNTIWKEKIATTTFTKNFNLGMNGVYYLTVKQAGKTAVKQIIKE